MLIALMIFVLGIFLHWQAERVEKASMPPKEYQSYRMYASALGPGAPANSWMVASTFCYVVSFMVFILWNS